MNTVRYKSDITGKQSILAALILLVVVLVLTLFTGCAELFHGDPPEDAPSSASAGIPQGLTAATPASGGINLYWNPVSGAEKYHILYGLSSDSITIEGGETTGEFLSVVGLERNKMYYFRVRSYSGAGWSDWSAAANAKTADVASIAPPASAPTGVTAIALSAAEILVSWTAAAGADRYRVFYATTGGTELSLNAEYSPARVSDLSPNTVYTFTVKAGNNGGWGDASTPASATTPVSAPPSEPSTPGIPGTPSGAIAAALSSSSIAVTWTAVSGAASYKVYRSNSGGSYSQVGTSANSPYTDMGLSAVTTYTYKVSAINSGGESGWSDSATATTNVAPPPTPSGVSATAVSSSSITVSWSEVSGATSYKVYRGGSNGGTYSQVGTSASSPYTDTGLSAGTAYYYKVSAMNAGGESGQSSYASATTNRTLAVWLAWLSGYAVTGGDYTIELEANETIGPATLSYGGKTVKITLKGDTAERTVSLGSAGSLFTVGSGVTLTLDNNVTLKGRSDNTASLVLVTSGATLAMKGNAKITGNGIPASPSPSSYSSGGGVYVEGGSFTMSDSATVSGNGAFSGGGGVCVNKDGSFTMSGNATVSGNRDEFSGGGGVLVAGGSFTMNGNATVSGNTTEFIGGGVYVYDYLYNSYIVSFTMSGNATVSGNTANQGGGVFVGSSGNFTKTGGIIYGRNETNPTLRNIVRSGSGEEHDTGAAVYGGNSTHRRETTVGAAQNLSKIGGAYTGQWTD